MINFLEDFLSVSLHFLGIVWTDYLHYFDEETFLTMVAIETRNGLFFDYHSNGCYEAKKAL